MTNKKDWLAMTRHERRGALALLGLALLVVVAVWLVRSRTHQLTPAEQQQMNQFELMTDSLLQATDSAAQAQKPMGKPKGPKGKGKTKGKGKAKTKGGKSQNSPQRMDPVPQF